MCHVTFLYATKHRQTRGIVIEPMTKRKGKEQPQGRTLSETLNA